MNELIHIVFTYDDVESWAEELGIDIETARSRADDWAGAITNTAIDMINDQLASVIEYNTP